MPAFLVTAAAMIQCPHMAPGTIAATGVRVLVGGTPAALLSDQTAVVGCPLASLPVPSPCVTVIWVSAATRVLVGGQPVLLMTSQGLAQNPAQVPQGPPSIVMTQTRVMGS